MMVWAHQQGLSPVVVVYCDTGWSSPSWPARVRQMEEKARGFGFQTARSKSIGMAELVRIKKVWPGGLRQFCTAHLKSLPFLQLADEIDPKFEAVVMIGKRREESFKRANTPRLILNSDYHSGRTVWHPLYLHSEEERDKILAAEGIEKLNHRSLECNPCIYANRADLLRLTKGEIERVNALEVELSQPLFRAKQIGALGIHGALAWAREGRQRGNVEEEEHQCSGFFGCGL